MNFKIEKITNLSGNTEATLAGVWEQSVRATHDFLNEEDIVSLRPMVREALAGIEKLLTADIDGTPVAFLGQQADKIEMLFVHPDNMRNGLGKELITYAIEKLGAKYVDVNEQNPQARMFYERMGFRVTARSETDGQGNAFPILHMEKV